MDLAKDVEQLKRTMYGDPDDPRKTPGLVNELIRVDATLQEISSNIKWGLRIIAGALILNAMHILTRT